MTTPDATASTSPRAHDALRLVARDIKLAHSIFALPFAVLAAIMAAAPVEAAGVDWKRLGVQLGLVVAAMFFARTVAMISNRIIDRRIDETNPRTAGRALPSGRLSLRAAVTTLVGAAGAFMVVCAGFGVFFGNWWPVALGLPVLAWIGVYAFFKRFTAFCHLYLGSALALSPIAAALAVAPASLDQPALWLLAVMVMCWVAGFDIIYALQDMDVDRAQGLHSVPGRFGVTRGLLVSRVLHGIACVALVVAAFVDPRLGALFGIGVAIVIGLLIYEHATVARWGTTKVALAFFTLNGIISCVLGALGSADVLA